MSPQTIAVSFAERLNKMRALTDDETDMLCAVLSLTREKRSYRSWKAKDDRELQRMLRRGMRASEIAQATGRTTMAVRNRIHRLRAKAMT